MSSDRKKLEELRCECIRVAANLVRLGDVTPKRGDPAHDSRPEVVHREAVVDQAMRLKHAADAAKPGDS